MNLEDLAAGFHIRHRSHDQLIEAPWPEQGRIYDIRAVGGPYHHYSMQLLETIHLAEELVDHPLRDMRLSRSPTAHRHQSIQLVQEDDGGSHLPGLVKYLFHPLLALSIPFREKGGALDGDEIGLALIGHRLGQHGLARSRRPVEQYPLRGIDSYAPEAFRIAKWPFHRLDQELLDRLQAPYILPADIGNLDQYLPHGRW